MVPPSFLPLSAPPEGEIVPKLANQGFVTSSKVGSEVKNKNSPDPISFWSNYHHRYFAIRAKYGTTTNSFAGRNDPY
ncbi:ArsR family transcriptional regulator [Anopheles sinensis]|uniref:ArsR family transcriptional regulator n=1 Tax=Anopheles sinensis TaxID=74873 RepID=A0A084VPK3_ANOSI|nr:ArsR family transcriptional regulator [Anopheles sinensis]